MDRLVLYNYDKEVANLLDAVNKKITANLTSPVNSILLKKLEIKSDTLEELLETIKSRLKRCQEIHHVYLEKINQDAINGISPSPNIELDYEIVDTFGKKRILIRLDNLSAYKELVRTQFQHYILSIASLYENFVLLSETLLRKIIIHQSKNPPLSMPLEMLIGYRKILLSLDYRQSDEFTDCIDDYSAYFDEFLPCINMLRNSFIHGYNYNIDSDGTSLIIKHTGVVGTLGTGSPKLEVDVFTSEIMDNTMNFARELILCLATMVRSSSSAIPI